MWWVTRVGSLRFGCSSWARTLLFNMSHTYLLGFKSMLCAGHWSVRRLLVKSITCVLLTAWRGVLSFANIISRLKRIWGKRIGRMMSFGCHIAFMFLWMRTTFFVCTWKRLCAFCYSHCCHFKCFSYKTIHEEYFPTKKRQLHCRAREARAHSYCRTYRSTRMVLYIKHVLFLLIDSSVCIIQNNQSLDVLIKYIL